MSLANCMKISFRRPRQKSRLAEVIHDLGLGTLFKIQVWDFCRGRPFSLLIINRRSAAMRMPPPVQLSATCFSASMEVTTLSGLCFNTLKRARAGPDGLVRACSQFCIVSTLTPINTAKSPCDTPIFCRMPLTFISNLKTRRGFILPASIAFICRTLSHSSLNAFFSILLTRNNVTEHFNLILRQIAFFPLIIPVLS